MSMLKIKLIEYEMKQKKGIGIYKYIYINV